MLSTKFFRKGAQVIATIDVITSVLTFISIFFLIFLTFAHGDRLELKVERDQNEHPELAALFALGRGPFIIIMLLLMFICVCYFYLARYLLHAANERSYAKIHRWCTITLVIIITRAAFFITAVFFTPDRAFVSSFGFIGFLYQIFCLWFIRTYEDRMRVEGDKMNFVDRNIIEIHTNMESFGYLTQAELGENDPELPTTNYVNHGGVGMKKLNLHQSGNEKFHCRFSHEDELHGQQSHLDSK